MAGIKGFIQFLSTILCVSLLVWICNADYHASLVSASKQGDMYSEWMVKEENSEFYTVVSGKKYYFTGNITQPVINENGDIEGKLSKYLEIERINMQSGGSRLVRGL